MTERLFDDYVVRSTAVAEGSRFTACLVVTPRDHNGYPVYYAVCENRSFREQAKAELAAASTLAAVLALEGDGTPVFPDGYTGFDDEPAGSPAE
ncbi:hypothetical protein ACXU4B_09925 [Dyella soli]|uniref:Uncharacterized protein n=1 Tax=Dyella soli TaxID=522319 RepID=A0A4R0YQX8_9GAMM|nr:hypothetical protein [Dyella soli]TCI11246.1 hypothetical protein EZM97_20815 [Dyella soli]